MHNFELLKQLIYSKQCASTAAAAAADTTDKLQEHEAIVPHALAGNERPAPACQLMRTFAWKDALFPGCHPGVKSQLPADSALLVDSTPVLAWLQLVELAAVVDADVLLHLMHLLAAHKLPHHVQAAWVGVVRRVHKVVLDLAVLFEVLISLVMASLLGEGKEACLQVTGVGRAGAAYHYNMK
jgi:hypothetical protein